jgi:CRISPR-associated endonuclease Csn1
MDITRKILGLDLGTNSIGWAIVEQNEELFSIKDKGVRIFSEGVKSEKGVESSRAAERTSFRSARKIKYRRKLRKYETLKVLSKFNMVPLTFEEVESYKTSGFKNYPLHDAFLNWLRTDDNIDKNPYAFRDKASREKINPMELGRALYHITQRRGFLSGRLDQSGEGILEEVSPILSGLVDVSENIVEVKASIYDVFEDRGIFDSSQKSGYVKDADDGDKKLISLYKALNAIISKNKDDFESARKDLLARLTQKENLGVVKGAIHDLTSEMKEKGFDTIGQLFFDKYSKSKIRSQHTSREEHYLAEFELICKVQGLGKINESEKLPEKRFEGIAKELYKAIFYQRPLKSQKGLIGKCSFEPTKSRCSVSHPDFEAFRMWNYLNTIKMASRGEELQPLSQAQKEQLIPKFFRKKDNFNFEDLAKELVPAKNSFGYYKSSRRNDLDYWFNYHNNNSVSGCPVSASLKSVFGEEWQRIEINYSTTNANGEQVNRVVNYHDLWHLLSTSTTNDYLYDFALKKLNLSEKQAKAFSSIRLKKDFGNLSLNAIRKILPYTQKGLLYSHAVFMANLGKVVDSELWNNDEVRAQIQNAIGEIIENHTLENAKIDVINGILKNMLEDDGSYSTQAEDIFKEELRNRFKSLVKRFNLVASSDELEQELFPILRKQLKEQEFLKIKRIDDKVKEFLLGENSDARVFVNDETRFKNLYHPSDIEKFKLKEVYDDNKQFVRHELGSPLSTSVKNPMAMRAIHQLRKVLNTLIAEGKIDKNTHVHIEMARELNDANRRKGIQDYQKELQNLREEYKKEIKKLYQAETGKDVEPTQDDILRYQLWIEQNKQEIYEPSINGGKAKTIGISQIIGSNPEYDIEHTIPRSISQDNSQSNKTLCSRYFNREVKKNKIPSELQNHDLILPFVEHWKKEADSLEIEINSLNKRIKAASTKEAKDRSIRKRHYLSLKKAYLEDKYNNFVRKEPKTGFKNSQIPDTGIITKYAQSYLRSYFKRVESVKGGMVAEFRKLWGVQKSYRDDNDKKHYAEKDRSKHTHHTIDAIVIACMTKQKYDMLAHAWTLEDESKLPEARRTLEASKPWKTFTEDIAKIEEEILVSHYTPDNLKKQSKKILRVKGKKQFVAEMEQNADGKLTPKTDQNGKIIYKLDEKGQKIPRLQQGDTVRGSLHQDTIYGRVKDPETKEIRSVVRKNLESLKSSDIEKIVDPEVREIVKKAILDKVLVLASNPQQANKINTEIGVWMNKEKGIQIKKVRVYTDSVKNPLEIKEHAPLSKSKHEHKQHVYGQNDENYAMAIYEGVDKKGKIKRVYEIVNNIDAGKFYRLSNSIKNNPLVPYLHLDTNYPLRYVLKKGDMVLFFENDAEELYNLNSKELGKRLYKLAKFDAQGRLTFRYHKEARLASELKEVYQVDFNEPFEQIRLQVSKLNILLNKMDFEFVATGEIILKTR